MDIKLQRGRIEDLTPPDKDGVIECRIGPYRVKAAAALAEHFAAGEDVMIAGEPLKGDAVQALAVNNYSREKRAHIDCTKDIYILGVAAYIAIFCGVFGMEGIGGNLWGPVQEVASIIGLAVSIWAIRRIIIITKADKWLGYAQLAEEAES